MNTKQKVLLVGDYEHEVQRTELVRERMELEKAGYEVLMITDEAVDPETGEVMLPNTELFDRVDAMMRRVNMVANYFTEESILSRYAIETAGLMRVNVRFSCALWWMRQEQPTHYGMWKRMMDFLDKLSSGLVTYNPMKRVG